MARGPKPTIRHGGLCQKGQTAKHAGKKAKSNVAWHGMASHRIGRTSSIGIEHPTIPTIPYSF